jgi:hypothetical protein
MFVTLSLYLFGKPGWMVGEGDVTPQELRDLAQELHEHLRAAADVVEKLTGAGWAAQTTLYEILFSPPALGTKAAVEEQLRSLGIDPGRFCIEEEDDEEDFAEDGDEAR